MALLKQVRRQQRELCEPSPSYETLPGKHETEDRKFLTVLNVNSSSVESHYPRCKIETYAGPCSNLLHCRSAAVVSFEETVFFFIGDGYANVFYDDTNTFVISTA